MWTFIPVTISAVKRLRGSMYGQEYSLCCQEYGNSWAYIWSFVAHHTSYFSSVSCHITPTWQNKLPEHLDPAIAVPLCSPARSPTETFQRYNKQESFQTVLHEAIYRANCYKNSSRADMYFSSLGYEMTYHSLQCSLWADASWTASM